MARHKAPKVSRKHSHLESSIQVKLSLLLQKRAADPRFSWVTITSVHISGDGAWADVQFSMHQGDANDALTEALNKASGFFRQALSQTLSVRYIPRIRFIYDRGFDHTTSIEAMLAQIASST